MWIIKYIEQLLILSNDSKNKKYKHAVVQSSLSFRNLCTTAATDSYVMALTRKSPEMLAPARIPVAAGKKMANTEKKSSFPLKSGGKFSKKIFAVREGGKMKREEEVKSRISKYVS